MQDRLLKEFKHPSNQYRGAPFWAWNAPFWAWNGKLDPAELRQQIRLMHRMGLGGFFMHARVGLSTPYLSPAWFACIKACVDEAKKLGMRAWLYDEDRWPSGAAGGLVTRHSRFRARKLFMEECRGAVRVTPHTVALFKARVSGHQAAQVQQLALTNTGAGLRKNESYLHFHWQEEAPSDWYNGQTSLDTMNHAAVREFIRVTHTAYRRNIGRHFGECVPGIFTDEPSFGTVCQRRSPACNTTPWTAALPRIFKQRYGYDLTAQLPAIFFDIDDPQALRTRYHYMDCITHLFVDAFSRQIGQWCEKNNMLHTGHVLEEDSLSRQTARVGSCMRFYEHMQAPGMDLLTEHNRLYDTAKQVSSMARQFNRKWRLTETYGCTGWDFPFAGHKALGDWQAALGINLRAQHLVWYTMAGEAKRDYPASIFHQSPWWEHYALVEDYFARINAVMSRGKEVRDLLVIHPVESMWLQTNKHWQQPRNEQAHPGNQTLIALRDALLMAQIDFDYGDEEIMSRHARVRRGAAVRLAVG
ncbi:MAG: hypothetical protein LC725_08280, partial [Lentisphaerae bacterium]|nr:hypothetical protein [Lentisphaerota bacterium]